MNNSKFSYSGVNNPCPICDRTKDKDCRINENGSMVLCHSSINGEFTKDGWKYTKPDESNNWGIYVEPDEKSARPVGITFKHIYSDRQGNQYTFNRKYKPDGTKDKDATRWAKPLGIKEPELLPYRWSEVKEAIATQKPIYLIEGELGADELIKLELTATNLRTKPTLETLELFKGANLVICPDRDETGIKKALAHYEAFKPIAASIKMMLAEPSKWDYVPATNGRDVYDWIVDGCTKEDIESAIAPFDLSKFLDKPDSDQDESFEGGKAHFWSSNDKGLVWESYKKDEESGDFKKSLTTIGNHLQAIAYVDNVDKNGASIYIEFVTQRGQIARWLLPRKDLVGKSDIIGELLARGYWYKVKERAKLVEYLIGLGGDTEQTYTITDRTGWVNKSFVLPNRTYGDETLKFKDIEPIKDTAFECKGTLEDWKSNVATLATGNSRLIFALGGAFSAPLAPLLEVESGGFHLFGATSTGKTSTLKLASSVMGIPSKAIQRWRATANGLEGLAVAHNHLLLPLDEIGQADPRDVGNAAYMLANGQGKTRANKTGDRIVPKTWNLQYLSTGEITLTNYLKSANITVKGGQEIRMLDLPACPVKGYGVLESIGKFNSPADFIHALDTACDRHCGTALDTFLNQLTQDSQSPEWVKTTKARLWEIATKLSKVAPTDEVIGRVSLRFALVQTALEVAYSYGLLPFPVEQIAWAISTMQTDWLNTRGGVGSLEMKQALERIENLFVVNQHSDRIYQVGETETNQVVRNLLAYRKLDTFDQAFEFWVPNPVFNTEIAKDCDRTELIHELQRKGWLKPSGADGKPYLGRRVNGKFTRVYVFTQFWSDENLGTDFEVLTKPQVSEVSQVSDTQNSYEYRVSPDTLDGYQTGISRYQRYQQDNFEIGNEGVIPVIPSENPTGITQVSDKSIDNKGFEDTDTCDTRDTHQNKETLKIGSQVKYLGTEHKVAQGKKLTIVSIDGEIAKVTYSGWFVELSVPLSELIEAIA